ncbi:hypothetical protein OG453_25355 [Streptomyces sp. NBC_01381]|uniref:hypothetical protein n=1 Tax=Streptomyces sp. NBC_01381 TaxID=2903845 RepID=UPI00224ECA7F|nr:hypothetical protein [Streptomyces sp. NBC_01381]MCX4669976.1 hypothetical protein [Streptomyces sp. NBC_01381]
MTPSLLASACLLFLTLSYGIVCWLSPFGRCRKCDGLGHLIKFNRRGKAKKARVCRRCHGHGIRIRRGRHWFNIARCTHRAGTR